jgi:hypothetical protein
LIVHLRHAKYRLARDVIDSYSRGMMKPTIGRLFELLMGPAVHTELEIAQLLGLDLMVLQARFVDLRKRGILRGPLEGEHATTWKSWFPTLIETTDALERSGLRAASAVPLRRAWWDGMWANN